MLNLRRLIGDYESRARSFGDVLPWLALVAPDIVLCKDGSLLACFRYAGVDVDGRDPAEADAAAVRIEHALRCFDERFILWSTVHRRRSADVEAGRFPDRVSERLERLHVEGLRGRPQYVNRHYLSIVRRPASHSHRFMARFGAAAARGGAGTVRAVLAALAEGLSFERSAADSDAALAADMRQFGEALDAFCGAMPRIGLQRLVDDDLLAFLHDCCSPASAGQPVAASMPLTGLDTGLCDNTATIGSRTLRFDGLGTPSLCAAVSLRQWPASTRPGLLDELLSAAGELTLSQVFRFVERDAAARYIKSVQRFNLNLQKPLSSYVREAVAGEESTVRDSGRAVAADDAADALTAMTGENRVFGYLNFTALLYANGEDALETLAKSVGATLRSAGFLLLRESFHLWPAWCGSVPGQWAALARWQFVSTANLADLCPVGSIHEGTPRNEYLARQAGTDGTCLTVLETEYRVPFHFNFHQGDLGHTFVIGPSRSGKSVFVNFLLSQFRRYHPVNVFVFDKDRSCLIPTVLHGGTYIDPEAAGGGLRLNPFRRLADAGERDWLAGWLERLLAQRGRRIDAGDARLLRRGLDDMSSLDPAFWRLRTLYGLLPGELRDELEPWVGDSGLGRYFDNASDTFAFADLCAVEIGSLLLRDGLAEAFMDYAMHRISQALQANPPRPTAIYLEEAWFLIGRPHYAERVRDWLKTIPKRLGLVVMATQSLADLERSDLFASIADNVPTRIYLPNRQADAFRTTYLDRFGLSHAQVDRIRDAIPKRQYYIVTPSGGRLVDVRFSPAMLACLRSDALGHSAFARHRAGAAADWVEAYLAEMAHAE